MSPTQRSDPPYRTIAAEIRARIEEGKLQPGERVPSIRQISQRRGVAIATATRAISTLRDEGLVETAVGSGTVVSYRAELAQPAMATESNSESVPGLLPPAPGKRSSRQPADSLARAAQRENLLRTAIAIADSEGLDAVSMRRLAVHLGVGPMSLYRHVANKNELLIYMADTVFGEVKLPLTGPVGWRAKLELIAHEHWRLCRRHLWLPQVISFTRPLLAPGIMAHTEWTMRALDGLQLSTTTQMRETLALHTLVLTVALSKAEEAEAEQDTGLSLGGWNEVHRHRTQELLNSGHFPLIASVSENVAQDLDGLFEYSLARHLDGFAALLERIDVDDS